MKKEAVFIVESMLKEDCVSENAVQSSSRPHGHLEAAIDCSLNRISGTHAAAHTPLWGVSQSAQVCEDAALKYTGPSGCEFCVG